MRGRACICWCTSIETCGTRYLQEFIQNTDSNKQVLTHLVSCTDHALAGLMLPDGKKATLTTHMLHLHSYTSRVSSTAWRPFAVMEVASTTILPLPEQEITSPALTTELPLASLQFTLHSHTCPLKSFLESPQIITQ